ncbi:MAG: nucleoside triphosphate pyrophosphohydrolase [Candidatus Nomurabacteria bacterium]|nr:nucleoside triphosphate pyrophosphohydrolase [Candidatus Nomurabacteria bacterium]
MEKTFYNKLVRDGIPDKLRKKGVSHETHIASEEEYIDKLKDKLTEEAKEAVEASKEELVGELADVIEVIHALAKLSNITIDDIEPARIKKLQERGGFNGKIILDWS